MAKKAKVAKKKTDTGVRKDNSATDNQVDVEATSNSDVTEVSEEAETEVVDVVVPTPVLTALADGAIDEEDADNIEEAETEVVKFEPSDEDKKRDPLNQLPTVGLKVPVQCISAMEKAGNQLPKSTGEMISFRKVQKLPPLPTEPVKDTAERLGIELTEIKIEEATLAEQVHGLRFTVLAQAVSIEKLQRKMKRLFERNHMEDED